MIAVIIDGLTKSVSFLFIRGVTGGEAHSFKCGTLCQARSADLYCFQQRCTMSHLPVLEEVPEELDVIRNYRRSGVEEYYLEMGMTMTSRTKSVSSGGEL